MSERGKPRPALFRALGNHEPPPSVEVDAQTYQLVEVFKHDSWAATAIYQGSAKKNRLQVQSPAKRARRPHALARPMAGGARRQPTTAGWAIMRTCRHCAAP